MLRFFAPALAFLIVVTSQQMAMARGLMADPTSQVVICSGNGPAVVTLDRNGMPVDGPGIAHICPECVLTLMGAGPVNQSAFAPVVHSDTLSQTPALDLEIPFIPKGVPARGPPRFL